MQSRPDSLDGDALERPAFRIARWLFVRGVALVLAGAFASLAVQILGLVGAEGIAPTERRFEAAHEALGGKVYLELPSVFWLIGTNDAMLSGVCFAGIAVSLLAFAGFVPRLAIFIAWVLYLSLFTAGQPFLGFQWDTLLLETSLLAILAAPGGWRSRLRTDPTPSWFALAPLWWLGFRLMFGSGLSKLQSGDDAWSELFALRYHFMTQPLPTPVAWWVHQCSDTILSALTFLTLVCELALPFVVFALMFEAFAPTRVARAVRTAGATSMIGLMIVIALTGNYGFFNVLAVLVTLLLIDDETFRVLARRRLHPRGGGDSDPVHRVHEAVIIGAAVVLLMLGTARFALDALPRAAAPTHVETVLRAVRPFASVNRYGLFATMTRRRPEITIEGSTDGTEWKPYEFRYKPGRLDRRPRWVAPHMPRLDWQLWFAALEYDRPASSRRSRSWFVGLLEGLFEGREAVTGLVAENPFADGPPRYLRATWSLYEFTTRSERADSGDWWKEEKGGMYFPVVENPFLPPGG